MRQLRKFLLLPAFLLAFALPARATVTLTFQADELLQGGNGSSNVAINSLVLVVADTTGGGFASLGQGNISVGSTFSTASNDLIVGQLPITAGFLSTAGENILNSPLNTSFFGSWTSGQALAIYWIPSLNIGDNNVGLGVAYGKYTDATGVDGSDPWFTPGNGGSSTFVLTTTGDLGTGGSVPASAGYASFTTTVPEPSTFALIGGLLALGATSWRRRKIG